MNCEWIFHLHLCLGDNTSPLQTTHFSRSSTGRHVALRTTVEIHGGNKKFSVRIQWKQPKGQNFTTWLTLAKCHSLRGEWCGRDNPNCENEYSALTPNGVFRFVVNTALVTTKIRYSYCTSNYKDSLLIELLTTKIRYSHCTRNYNYSMFTLCS